MHSIVGLAQATVGIATERGDYKVVRQAQVLEAKYKPMEEALREVHMNSPVEVPRETVSNQRKSNNYQSGNT